jgi:hypothetical protein
MNKKTKVMAVAIAIWALTSYLRTSTVGNIREKSRKAMTEQNHTSDDTRHRGDSS